MGVATLLLAGCASPPSRPAAQFVSARYKIAVHYPANALVTRRFGTGYLVPARWNPALPADVPGRALLSIELSGSNNIRRAVLRLGVSDSPEALRRCSTFTQGAGHASRGVRSIDGVSFAWRQSADAAMSHFRLIRQYRAVHENHCYAIDLIVAETQRGVYDDPPPTPFSRPAALRRLRALLGGVRFMR